MFVMFSLPADPDEPTSYQSYSPAEYSADSRSGSQSPLGLAEGSSAAPTAIGSSLGSSKNTRKRRAQLLPINLVTANASEADELSTELPSTSNSTPSSDEESSNHHLPRAISKSSDPHDKRIRLTSSSSTSSTASLLSLISEGSQSALITSDSYNDLADSEFGQSTPGVKLLPSFRNGTFIADGEFELVGSGQECKAVHVPTKTIHHCMALNRDDYNSFMSVVERIESAKYLLTVDELRELRRLLVPEETRIIRAENRKTWYMISPDHQGSLHTFYTAENPSAIARTCSPWSEHESRAIFEQIVRLVSHCHKIGIYFGDFRLQKLVYTNRKSNLIRVLHLRNIYVAPSLHDDTIQKPSSKCCPAYIAPEMMKFDKPYSAKLADVWSLGILAFILLTGRFPFYAPKPVQLARMIRQNQWSFKSTDKLSRSARLLVYSLIRQNPLERPSAKEILISDWFQSELSESAFTPSSSQSRPHVTVQLVMPANGRLADVNPRIPQQLLGVLMQPAADRNNIYLNRSNIRVNMESFANALNRNMNAGNESLIQVVPETPQVSMCVRERDSLNITVIRVPASRSLRNN